MVFHLSIQSIRRKNEMSSSDKRFPASWVLQFLIGMLAISVTQPLNADPAFSSPQNITMTAQDSSEQQVAASGSNVFLVWRDNRIGADVFDPEVYLARSTDGGKTFGSTVNISDAPGTQWGPRLAASGQHVYVVFSDASGDLLVHSADGGDTFSVPVNLTTAYGIQMSSLGSMAAAGSNVYLVWRKDNGGADDIFFSRSVNNGESFSVPENISNTAGHSLNPKVAASGNNVYLAWEDPVAFANDIYFKRSTNGGLSFEDALNVSNNSSASTRVAVDADGMRVWLAWKDNASGNEDIMFTQSSNAGLTFETVRNLSVNLTGSIDPVVAGKGNRVHVAWADVPPGALSNNQRDIYLMSSTDFGLTFDAAQNLSNTTTIISGVPRIAICDVTVSVYWGEGASFRDVYSSYLEIQGPPPVVLSLSPASARQAETVDVVINGTGFQPGAQIGLSGSGVTINSINLDSPTQISVSLTAAVDAPLGSRDVTVTNLDGQSSVLPGAFAVMSASALNLIEIARVDVTQCVDSGQFLTDNNSFKSLLAHLSDAEAALLGQPPALATAIDQMDAFYVKIGNMAKGDKPYISNAMYQTLYEDYRDIMISLGEPPKAGQ
jgi:hypothetical protein